MFDVFVLFSFQLIYLKITALLFPTSDFRHPVTIPAFLCISQALTQVCVCVCVYFLFLYVFFFLPPLLFVRVATLVRVLVAVCGFMYVH